MTVSRALHTDEPSAPRAIATARAPVPARIETPGFFRQPLAPILTSVGVAVLVVLAITFARANGLVAALWGASGLAAAVWLRGGRGGTYDLAFGVLVAVGLLAGQFMAGNRPSVAVMFTVANLIEIILAVALTRRFVPNLDVATLSGLTRFLALGSLVAALPSAVFSGVMLKLMQGADLVGSIQSWWLGHALSLAVVGSLGLAFRRQSLAGLRNPVRMAEAAAILLLIGGTCATIFSQFSLPLGFVLMPLLILMAMRFRVIGTAVALLLVAVLAVGGTMLGGGPYGRFGFEDRALMAQMLVLLGYMPILLVAALLEERAELARRAEAGQARAERASAAKSRLLANVAHEIKSPVSGVIGIGELWAGGQLGPASASQVEMAQMLVRTARQIEALTHDLLDVARAEAGAVKVELRPTNLEGLLEDVRRTCLLRPEAEGLRVDVRMDEEGLVALADSQRLTQVVGNLAVNAVKYGRSGGVIELKARRRENRVRIEVVDYGPGLSPEKQAQLFEPFNRLGLDRSVIEGHGVGLALAKRLTELQGGEIGVASSPGAGAVFWLELPSA